MPPWIQVIAHRLFYDKPSSAQAIICLLLIRALETNIRERWFEIHVQPFLYKKINQNVVCKIAKTMGR